MSINIRNFIRAILVEEFDYSAEELAHFDKENFDKEEPILKFYKEEPWWVSIKIENSEDGRDFNYIIKIVEKLIKERNIKNYPVKTSWTSLRTSDFIQGMKEIKDLLNKSYEVKFISYNPTEVEHKKTFVVHFQLENYSPEYARAVSQMGGD